MNDKPYKEWNIDELTSEHRSLEQTLELGVSSRDLRQIEAIEAELDRRGYEKRSVSGWFKDTVDSEDD